MANVVRGVGAAMGGPEACAQTDADLYGGLVEIEERFLRSAARRAKMRREGEESGCSGRNDKKSKRYPRIQSGVTVPQGRCARLRRRPLQEQEKGRRAPGRKRRAEKNLDSPCATWTARRALAEDVVELAHAAELFVARLVELLSGLNRLNPRANLIDLQFSSS